MGIEDSHRRLLLLNKVEIHKLTNANIETTLRNLRTKKNKELSTNYIIGILATIKKYNNSITYKPAKLNFTSTRKKSQHDNKAILELIKYVYSLNKETIQVTTTVSTFDLYIAILLLTSTNISLTDLYNINTKQFTDFIGEESLNMSKKIIKYQQLFKVALPLILNLVKVRFEEFKDVYSMVKTKFNTHMITSSPDVINKRLRDLYSLVNFGNANTDASLGLYSFTFKHPEVIVAYLYGGST